MEKVLILLIVFLVVLLVVLAFRDKSMIESLEEAMIICLVTIIVMIGGVGCHYFLTNEHGNDNDKTREEIRENANNLSFYIDGNNVKYENIDLNQYDISYDKENKRAYLTSK